VVAIIALAINDPDHFVGFDIVAYLKFHICFPSVYFASMGLIMAAFAQMVKGLGDEWSSALVHCATAQQWRGFQRLQCSKVH
jgi:hypothetical protein